MARAVQVAVPIPQVDLLTYRVPDQTDPPPAGARVLVSVGQRLLTGIVVGPAPEPAEELSLKPLSEVLDDEPFVPEACLSLALWTAEYYACAPGEAVALTLPPLSTLESRLAVMATDAGRALAARDGLDGLDPAASHALQIVAAGGGATVATVGARLAKALGAQPAGGTAAVIRRLQRAGLVERSHVVEGRRSGHKSERVAVATDAGRERVASGDAGGPRSGGRLGPKQEALLRALVAEGTVMAARELAARGLAIDALRSLAARGLVTVSARHAVRDPFEGPWAERRDAGTSTELTLTDEQQHALRTLTAWQDDRAFRVALVHGVTGSGKTELYLRLAGRTLASGRQALVLVPEIGLTPAVATAFRARFGDRVAVQHSGLSDGERHDQWQRIRTGGVDIVVGTRSAAFAPLDSIGLLVVDEEHDAAYKQDESPRYHGRDVALVRGQRAGALVVLGSATPSLESYRHAKSGRYGLVEMAVRVAARPLATVTTVNMRNEYAAHGPDTIVSQALAEQIGIRLERREQVLLLLNRRGFSTAVFCRQCGSTVECPNCSVSLVVYGRGHASCHYCGHSRRVPRTCPSCGAPYLELMGFGTERVEREVVDLFPAARVARIDRDTVRRRGALPAILDGFHRGEIDIIVGTQMIAKGHDFPRVTLVGVISADVGLGLADFRASERTFQLLTQVVGRAGRGDLLGEAVIQTVYPEHPCIRHACRQDYRAFYEDEIAYRTSMHYPPDVALINVVVRGLSYGAAIEDAEALVRSLVRLMPRPGAFVVLGPAPAALARIKGEYRAQFFVKAKPGGRVAMREAVLGALREHPEARRRVSVDVDPLTVL